MKKEEIKLTMKILIIENDKVQSEKLKNILFELNIIDLTILNDTTFIIKELQANSFDFIFCNAENADVVTILLKFVRNKETQNVIIMNSGSENISQLIYDMCLELNYKFVSILYKPFDVDSLKKLLCGVDKKKIKSML